jgi:flagellar motor component MotA
MDGILNLVVSGYDGYTKIKALMEDDIEEEETRRYPKKRHLLWSRVGSSRV